MTQISTERLLRIYIFTSLPLILLLIVASVVLYMNQARLRTDVANNSDQVSSLDERVSNGFSGVYDELRQTQSGVDGVQSSVDRVCQRIGEPLC